MNATPSFAEPFFLVPLTPHQLEHLAASLECPDLASKAEPGSLPPAFVAARTLGLAEQPDHSPWSVSFLIARSGDSRFVGACGFKGAPVRGRVAVGYGVAPSARGAGAATTALRALCRLAFGAGATEVLAEILPQNLASARVAQKAGFHRAGSRTDEDGEDVVLWVCRPDEAR